MDKTTRLLVWLFLTEKIKENREARKPLLKDPVKNIKEIEMINDASIKYNRWKDELEETIIINLETWDAIEK